MTTNRLAAAAFLAISLATTTAGPQAALARSQNPSSSASASFTWVIPAKFDGVGPFREGLAPVQIGDKWGYIDRRGTVVIPPQFDDAALFRDGLAQIQVGDAHGFVDRRGVLAVKPQFARALFFSEGMAHVQIGDDQTGKWGFIDHLGKFVIPATFDAAFAFREGLALFRVGSVATGKFGYLDTQGRIVIPAQFAAALGFKDGVSAVRIGDAATGKWGFIDSTGQVVIRPVHDEVRSFSEGLASFRAGDAKTGKWGYIDKTGRIAVAAQFTEAWAFAGGSAIVKLADESGRKWGSIDTTGTLIRSVMYPPGPIGLWGDGLAAFAVKGKWGFMDQSAAVVIEPQFDSVHLFEEGLATACIGKGEVRKCGFIARTAPQDRRVQAVAVPNLPSAFRWAIEPRFAWANNFRGDLALVGDPATGKSAFIDTQGRLAFDAQFDAADDFYEGVSQVQVGDDAWGKEGM